MQNAKTTTTQAASKVATKGTTNSLTKKFDLHRLMTSLNLNWSISTIIVVLLAASPFLGLILGESRLKRTTLGTFVGIALALVVTHPFYQFLSRWNLKWLTEPHLALGIFLLMIVLMNMGPLPRHSTAHRLGFRVMILGFLLATLLFSSLLLFLPTDVAHKFSSQSTILAFLDSTRVIWISAAAIWLVVMNLTPTIDKPKK